VSAALRPRGRCPCISIAIDAYTYIEVDSRLIRHNKGGVNESVKVPGSPKEVGEFDDRRNPFEPITIGDLAFIWSWKVDEAENCAFRWASCAGCTSHSSGGPMANNARSALLGVLPFL